MVMMDVDPSAFGGLLCHGLAVQTAPGHGHTGARQGQGLQKITPCDIILHIHSRH
jgi:hypothetical protein